MPTKHKRIGVVEDQALLEALESVAPIVDASTPAARVVHDLAVRGAQALREDAERRKERLGELAHLSTDAEPPWDRDVLARIDDLTGP